MHRVQASSTPLLDIQKDPVLIRFFWLASFIFTVVGIHHLASHLLADPPRIWRAAMSVALIITGLSSNILLLRKQYMKAFVLMIWGGWFITTAVTVVSGGIYSPNLMIYPVLIFAGGWLLSLRTGMALAAMSLTSTLGLAVAEMSGRLPVTQTAPISVAATTAAAMVIAATLSTYYFTKSYQRRYREIHKLSVELRKSEAQLAYVLSVARESVWSWDIRDDRVVHDHNWCDVLGFDKKYLQHPASDFVALVHEGDRERMMGHLRKCIAGAGAYRSEHRMFRSDGRMIWVRDRADIFERDESGKPLRMIGSITDITERKKMEEQVHLLAFYDALTRLPNRRLFQDRLGQALATSKRTGCHGALMLLDLDNFKPLNDTHGHAAGDLLLKEVAQRLKACVRETDTVARLGGDEFVVILAELKPDLQASIALARAVAEKIRTTLSAPYHLDLRDGEPDQLAIEHRCSASIGVTLFQDQYGSQDGLLQRADAAMYQAKKSGRNQIKFSEPEPT